MKKQIAFLFAAMLLFAAPVSAVVPEGSYIYDDSSQTAAVPSAPAAHATDVITHTDIGVSALNSPQDICADGRNRLYIADSGNNRILVLDSQYTLLREISTFQYGGKEHTFQNPQGVFVDSQYNLFVADTENARVVKFYEDGSCAAVFTQPQSTLFPDDFQYKPIKVTTDQAGRIFVVSSGFNMGLIELNKDGDFVQMLGSTEANFSLTDLIWRLISTKAQRDRMKYFVPSEYNNVTADAEGFLFVTTPTSGSDAASATPIRRLNAKGTDTLKRAGLPVSGDLETDSGSSIKGPSLFVDVCALEHGIYAGLDQKRGRVFVYNMDGDCLFILGGLGQSLGMLQTPTALCYVNNRFLVLDAGKASVVAYELTEYGGMLIDTQKYKALNEFEKEKEAWELTLKYNENNPLILREQGKIAYKERDMKTAMSFFKRANDKENYSKAFQFYRQDMVAKYFTAGVFTAFGLLAVIIAAAVVMKKRRAKYGYAARCPKMRYVSHVIFHPFDGFWDTKYEKRGSVRVATGILAASCLSMIIQTQFTGFAFNTVDPKEVNFLMDIIKVLLPFALWIVASWCVTSLMNGEGSFKEIYIASAYSLTPLVLFIPFASIVSNVLTLSEKEIYTFFVTLAYIWMVFLLIISVKQTHNYSMRQALGVIVISLLVIAIIVFIALLCFALLQQMVAFVSDAEYELSLRFQ